MKVTVIQPCMVNGQHKEIGDTLELDPNDAMAIVSAGRGTIDEDKAAAAKAEAKKKA